MLERNGLGESSVGTDGSIPITTASDIALFLEKLYNGQVINRQYSDEMLAILKNQKLNNKLPKYLPNTIQIAHKTGELGDFTHDGGIVYTPKGDYIIIILSKSDYPPGAEDRIAQVSKAVYTYFTE